MFAWSGWGILAGKVMLPRENSFLILHRENFPGTKADGDHSRVAMAEGRRSENNLPATFCGEWTLQWDLSVEILLPKCQQRYSLCLAAGGDVSLHSYLSGQAPEESQLSMLACFLIYHSVPTPGQLAAGGLEGESGTGIREIWAAFPCPPAAWEYTSPEVTKGKERQLGLNFGSSVPCLGLGQKCP